VNEKKKRKKKKPRTFVLSLCGYSFFGLVVVCGGCVGKRLLNKYVITRECFSRAILKWYWWSARSQQDVERGGPLLSSLSLPDWSLPSGEAVTVLTDLEVEIQQCRLRHVMEAPTLGPLYAHCNRQKKQTPLYIWSFSK